ncbi:hypothetical protein [Lacipirellula limnantheis]|uniref:hypothetical protein n=1 Tax=Lacipirellula limnantheis TaxID=2528024 RepID=UPI0011A6CE3E|nr:hypothetical protein [Lacipirellula limnantheis]
MTLLIDGLVLIAAGSLCRWAMPERFTVRRLLTVTAVVAIIAGIFRASLRSLAADDDGRAVSASSGAAGQLWRVIKSITMPRPRFTP